MNSKQIERLLWANKWTRTNFMGCYAADQIPTEILKFPSSLIINLDTKDKPGSHWVAVYIKNKSHAYYFDSFGPLNCLNPSNIKPDQNCITGPNSNIYNFLKIFEHLSLNKSIYQSIFSHNCGYFCIFFIYSMSIGKSFSNTVSTLDRQDNPNYFVFKFVQDIIKANK